MQVRSHLRWLAAGCLLMATTRDGAAAERLLVPSPNARAAGARGIANVRSLRLDTRVLASLRARTSATLTGLPLGPDTIDAVTVTRFEPFSPQARVELVEAGGLRQLALPDQLYYRGRVDGDPRSLVVVAAAPDAVRGLVSTNGTTYRFGPDRAGVYRSWALRDADPAVFPMPPPSCEVEALGPAHPARARLPVDPPLRPRSAFAPTLLAEVAIDTDEEFLSKFQSSAGALAYLADLAATVSSIYDADVGVRLTFRYIRLWATTDPWTAPNASLMVYQTSAYWGTYEQGTPRDLMHFISGKDNVGGAAFLGGLCNNLGYSASVLRGAFDLLNPADAWDIYLVAHEMGHTFGSVHTHCYNPPLDHCSNTESGCWSGGFDVPPEGGTIMSYCGPSYLTLTFGPTVSAVLRSSAGNGVCLGLPCGDGHLDPGEECDDGNVSSGDCCSPSCTAGPDGGSCDEGNVCTVGGTCAAGACVGIPVADGAPCDDGKLCTSDACVAGSCVGVLGPAASCKRPTQPLASNVTLKNNGGGSSTKFRWKWGKGAATALEEFGDPTRTEGYEVCFYEADSGVLIGGRMPPAGTCKGRPCWKSLGGQGFGYKDPEAWPDGMKSLTLKAGVIGRARIAATGENITLRWMSSFAQDLALPLRVQLHGAGGCWEATFSTPDTVTYKLFKAKSD